MGGRFGFSSPSLCFGQWWLLHHGLPPASAQRLLAPLRSGVWVLPDLRPSGGFHGQERARVGEYPLVIPFHQASAAECHGLQGPQAVPGTFWGCSTPSISPSQVCFPQALPGEAAPLPAHPGHSPLPAPHLIHFFGIGRALYAAHLHCTAGRARLGGIFPYNLWPSLLPAVSDPAGWRCSSGGMSRSFPARGIGSAAASWCFFSPKLMALPSSGHPPCFLCSICSFVLSPEICAPADVL